MKRRILPALLCVSLLLTLLPAASADAPTLVAAMKVGSPWCVVGEQAQLLDGENSQVVPMAEQGRTLVPVGQVVKAYGGTASWSLAENRAAFTLGEHTVTVEIGTANAWVDGVPAVLEVPSRAVNNRTYVPLRFVLENLGLTVGYDGTRQMIFVGDGELGDLSALPQGELLAACIDASVQSEEEGREQYYYNAVRQSELRQQQMYAQFGVSMLSAPYMQYDSTSALGDEQVYNTDTGESYGEHFQAQAHSSRLRVDALNADAQENGYSLSARGRREVDTALREMEEQVIGYGSSSMSEYLAAAYGGEVTEDLFRRLMLESALADEYAASHRDSLSYDEAALNAYVEENPANVYSYDYRLAYISGFVPTATDDEGNTVEATDEQKTAAMGAAKTKADVLAEGVRNVSGDKSAAFNRLVVDAVDADSGYADPENNLHTGALGSALAQNGVPYYDWLTNAERKVGDIEVIESGSGYYVVLLVDRYLNNAGTVDMRHILFKAEYAYDADGPTQEQMGAAKAEAQAALDRYLNGEQTAEAFGALAERYSEDTSSNTKGGLYTYVEEGAMVKGLDDWLFDPARQSGDTGLVEQNEEGSRYFGWHVVYFQGKNGPKWHEVAENALSARDMEDWLNALDARYGEKQEKT